MVYAKVALKAEKLVALKVKKLVEQLVVQSDLM
jgi:hypothetical protein